MLITACGIGTLIFTNWFSSANQITQGIADDVNERIYNQIYSFIQVPEQINKENYKIIENGILDINDEISRDKFFVNVLKTYENGIYSFSYGNTEGEYYGARRNEKGVIEIMRNNASTGGNSWYYSVKDDMTAGELVFKAGKFDPRMREWYKAASDAGTTTFSPVYKHFIMDDLAISSSYPVYKEGKLQGVLGTHLLLTDIGDHLKDEVSKYNGYSVILEKESGALIANSMGDENFTVLSNGTLIRYGIDRIEDSDFKEAYKKYYNQAEQSFCFAGKNQNIHINVKEIHMQGLDWVVISAIPYDFFISPVMRSIYITALLTLLILLLSLGIYMVITGRLLKPVDNLLQASEALSSGDLTKRVDIVRYDEIGRISESFNKVAEKMQYLINNLEAAVRDRTEELNKVNANLEDNKNKLQLILDSTAEAIYGIDLDGRCTFCNKSCIEILGYSSQDDLLGKNMHEQIHSVSLNGTQIPISECRIFKSIKEGRGVKVDDEVFWRADGTFFDVEYHSYPQIKDGKVVGGVVTFFDITERKRREAEIQYLSHYDVLTGFLNRRSFEDYCRIIDKPENLPLSVIYADINGLKMTNDIFGHATGDKLIKKSAEILMKSCRGDDKIARVGGDEFVILLPKTNKANTEKILERIKTEFSNIRVTAIKCSISLGSDIKESMDESLQNIIANAEREMYKDKTMSRKDVNKEIIDTLVETFYSRSPREKQHSKAVCELCIKLGSALNLPENEISILKRACNLHDIGKIVVDENILLKDSLSEDEYEQMKQHSVIGYRILNLFDDTLDLAEIVYSHHERWDGTGHPRHLKGTEIPLISRIISIAETYERILTKEGIPTEESKRKAIEYIKEGAGKQFDPLIAEFFVQMMEVEEP
ncbi:MAG TPA: diguanylate cyclase [Clostridiales bacterium]|nr:diguanylate cyclase [Clostridiales bacterium]